MDNIRSIRNSCITELLGTMLFVFCGTASTLLFNMENLSSKESIAFAFGVSYAVLVNITAPLSSGYLNTAVTVAMMIRRKMSYINGICCTVVQCTGGILGSGLLLYLLAPERVRHTSLGATTLGLRIPPYSGVCVEIVMTFLLVFTVLICTDGSRKVSDSQTALWCGLVITGCHLFGLHFTGCGMNPARSLGPAVISGTWDSHWVYWAGPIMGSLIACLVHYLASNFPVITDEDMMVSGEAIDVQHEVFQHQSEYHEHVSDKVSDMLAPESPRFQQVPTEMKTYL